MVQMNNQALTLYPHTFELIEYGDFSCQRCRELQKVLTAVLPLFDGEVIYTFRHFPDRRQPSALLMAMVAEAARRQHQYWAMHQALFDQILPFSIQAASTLALLLGIDTAMLINDLHDETLKQRIEVDIDQGHLAGVASTPTLFLDNRHLHGRLTQARLAPLIRHYIDRSTAQVIGTVDQENGQVYWSGTGHRSSAVKQKIVL